MNEEIREYIVFVISGVDSTIHSAFREGKVYCPKKYVRKIFLREWHSTSFSLETQLRIYGEWPPIVCTSVQNYFTWKWKTASLSWKFIKKPSVKGKSLSIYKLKWFFGDQAEQTRLHCGLGYKSVKTFHLRMRSWQCIEICKVSGEVFCGYPPLKKLQNCEYHQTTLLSVSALPTG